MNEKPKSIWKKSLRLPQIFMAWLGLMVVTMLVFVVVMLILNEPFTKPNEVLGLLVFGAVSASVLLVGWVFVRWLCNRRNLKRTLFGLACFVTLMALFYAEEDWRGKHDWEKFKREGEATGEKFYLAEIIPPPVPDDQNFAMAPVFDATDKLASRKWRNEHRNKNFPANGSSWDTNLVDRLEMCVTYNNDNWPTNSAGNWQTATVSDLTGWSDYYRTLAATTNEFPVAQQPQTPAQDVLLALSKYDSVIEELRQASQRPHSQFPLDYDDENPAEILLPHLAILKVCSQTLRLRATAELAAGQNEKALEDVKLLLRLTDSIRTEPFLISHLVRMAIFSIAFQPVYEGLAERKWSDAQLAALDVELAKFDFLSDYASAIRGERACNIGVVEYLRRAHNKFRTFADLTGDTRGGLEIDWATVILSCGPSGWFYQNELNCSRFFAKWDLPLVDAKEKLVSPAAVRAADKAHEPEVLHRTPGHLLEAWLLPALGNAVKKFAEAQSSTDLARTAIALERFRLAHGEFPESLDALAPQFLAKLPHDVIGGQPLKYRRTNDGQFVLYSVGWNETDDGGVVIYRKGGTVPDISQGDWVWRYPAK
jgi:hypothetical protein